ncbi:hypothetical protein [Vagococcus hydrophili]|uniref:DUF771 domain-containing protein n=1 Tax=Vagococcus hydrophili TaxID=2714947 RepID=A0A6G8ARC1_9ENTE|nr:hypothetical protein [Vagococcus hydrophili]QIL47546.1 hypothetical protein G7082_02845 [Vagococcus hydrophili]
MDLQKQFENLINESVDKRVADIEAKIVKPWVLMRDISGNLEKEARWITKHFCTTHFINLGLVKKIGGEWHFLNPEFLNYIHDVWWKEQK